jgi:hypothetical protein
LIYGGAIASLEQSELQGTAVLRYGDRVLPAKLWMDAKDDRLSVSHRGTSLLTNATLDVTPTFGLTTRVDSSFLDDGAHMVFWSGDGRFKWLPRSRYRAAHVQSGTAQGVDLGRSRRRPERHHGGLQCTTRLFRKTAQSFGDPRVSKYQATAATGRSNACDQAIEKSFRSASTLRCKNSTAPSKC